MKNLSKKIGAGVVASSLILGGAVSTGLVANADSFTSQYQATEAQEDEYNKGYEKNEGIRYNLEVKGVENLETKVKKYFGDLELFKAAKDKFGFEVMGYYLEENYRMEQDINELLNDVQAKFGKSEKYEKIKQILNKENATNYPYAGSFFMDLCKHGMSKGIKKVKIGDAVAILFFKDEAQPQPNYEKEVYKWAQTWKTSVQLSDIEGEDHKLVFGDMLDFIEKTEKDNLEAQYISEAK